MWYGAVSSELSRTELYRAALVAPGADFQGAARDSGGDIDEISTESFVDDRGNTKSKSCRRAVSLVSQEGKIEATRRG